MATFLEVGAAIASERDYQDSKWTDLDKTNTPDDFITYIEKYVKQLREAPAEQKQDFFRKVAALGVVAMEKFGAPHREGFERVVPHCQGGPKTNDCAACEEVLTIPVKDEVELSPEQIDAMVKQEQDAVEIVRGKYYRVNELRRGYYRPGGTVDVFDNVRAFAVMPSGGHRLINNLGVWFYVQPGWRVLAVDGGLDGGVEVQ